MNIKTPKFWSHKGIIAKLLKPLAALYYFIVTFRKLQAEPKSFDKYTIVLGNITIGGAGKTPSTIMLSQILKDLDLSHVILAKGYKGKAKSPIKVNLKEHDAAFTGDEPQLLAKSADTYISKDRLEAIDLINLHDAKILLMDDGLQNPKIKSDFKILVIDGGYFLGNGLIFPSGPLRDKLESVVRDVDCIFYVKRGSDDENLKYLWDLSRCPIFTIATEIKSEHDLQREYFAFAGLANNQKFYDFIEEKKLKISARKDFADHQDYSDSEIEELVEKAKSQNLRLITTEKDIVKISQKFHNEIDVVKITFEIDEKEMFIAKFREKYEAD